MEYKLQPYDWQLKAIDMSYKLNDMALLADMGTGKTGAMVNILRTKYTEDVRKTLVLSPLVTLYNWKNEFNVHSYIHEDDVLVVHGTSAKKLKILEKGLDKRPNRIVLMNYEGMISKNIFAFIREWKPEILVLDESHYVKSHKSKRSKNVYLVAKDCDHRFIMTGTPMTNSIADIFMQYKILDNGETFGTQYYPFESEYMYDANQAWSHSHNHFRKMVAREDKLDDLHNKIYAKAIRVTKDETLDLPPLVQSTYPVDLSPKQKKYYKELQRDLVSYVSEKGKEGAVVAQTAMAKALRLQQIVTGFVKTDENEIIEIEDNPRLKACAELVENLYKKHKIILWCSFKHNYKQLGNMLTKMEIDHGFITGDQDITEKRETMNKFNDDDDFRVIVCNRKAGGIGVNLVAASYSIVYSRNFSLEEELQSRDRNYRGGSEIHDTIYKIDLTAKDTIDEQITSALQAKKSIADKVIEIATEI